MEADTAIERERRNLRDKLPALLPEEGRVETAIEGLAVTGRTAQKDRKAAEQAVDGWLQGLGR